MLTYSISVLRLHSGSLNARWAYNRRGGGKGGGGLITGGAGRGREGGVGLLPGESFYYQLGGLIIGGG